MPTQFDNYKYIGLKGEEIDENKDYKFDNAYVASLCSSHRFQEAADYYKKYDFSSNQELQRQVWDKIDELETAARRENAIYTRVEDKRIVSNIRFADAVLQPGGIDEMRYRKDDNGNYIYPNNDAFKKENPLAGEFLEIWNRLGGITTDNTVKMDVSIPRHKKGGVWFFGRDWTVADIDDEKEIYGTLQKKWGITREDIEASGITYDSSDAENIKFTVPKTSKYAKQFMYAVGTVERPYQNTYNHVNIVGYTSNGTKTSQIKEYWNPDYGSSYGGRGRKETISYKNDIFDLVDLIDKADVSKQAAIQKLNGDKPIRTSGTAWSISLIQSETDKKRVIDFIKGNPPANYQHYMNTNGGNLEIVEDDEDYTKFMKDLSAADYTHIEFQGYTNNGITGLLITLNPEKDSNGEAIGDVKQLFVPDYLQGLVGYDAERLSDVKAIREYDNMCNYGSGYRYTFEDGSVAFVDEGGNVRRQNVSENVAHIDNSSDAREKLIRDIDRDYIIKHAGREAIRYVNNNGEIDVNSIETLAETVATAAIDELYPNTPLYDIHGNQIDVTTLFKNREKIYKNINKDYNQEVKKKLEEMYSIYDTIVGKALRTYNPIKK